MTEKNSHLPRKFLSETPYPKVTLDAKGRKLISALAENARLTPTYLGKQIGLSKEAVRARIAKLKKQQVVLDPVLIINPYALGYQVNSVFLRLSNLDSTEEVSLIEFLMGHPYSVWVGLIGGEWDVAAHFFSRDSHHFNGIMKEIKDRCAKNLIDFMILEVIANKKYDSIPQKYRAENSIRMNGPLPGSSYQSHISKPPADLSDEKVSLDNIDVAILTMLSVRADRSVAELSRELNKSFDAVKNRITRLINKNVILSFNSLISLTSLGLVGTTLFIETVSDDAKLERSLISHPSVLYLLKSQGRWDWQVYIITKDHYEFYAILRDLRSRFTATIRSYSSISIMRDFKVTFLPKGMRMDLQKGTPLTQTL